MNRILETGLVAFAAIIMMPATAQTATDAAPTAENAHKFLQISLVGTGDDQVVFTSVSSSGCTTNLNYKYSGDRYLHINWSGISALNAVDADKVVVIGLVKEIVQGPPYEFPSASRTIKIGSPEMAARVLKAMEVIRQSCDKTQGLGF